ncbi:hypothetical protein [Paracholeplasma manati]|jgi:hypothetical protein|uniref:Uncharacterized protein n=1 Tax=Paracholeplasma manati TaxID=591373 RepID=A0ABT2Y6J5_9MOLU|nr:hypothetical protein [Paracholeplasma manati]MCV2232373.1 hypothetical protein [Paracholeplasma manati]MDG0888042.1 hypothetical protein [Paracholeplasma manati]MDX9807574.1 hypothetical protein [Acholeplasma sp.]
MHSGIIRETVLLDKVAREKVEKLEKEKAMLDIKIKADEKKIQLENMAFIQKTIDDTKTNFENEIALRKETELKKFNDNLALIKSQFDEHEEQWIDMIYSFCIK